MNASCSNGCSSRKTTKFNRANSRVGRHLISHSNNPQVPESFKEARAAHLAEACGDDVMFLSYQLSESSSSSSSAFDPRPDHLIRRKQLAATCSATFSPRLAPASPEKR